MRKLFCLWVSLVLLSWHLQMFSVVVAQGADGDMGVCNADLSSFLPPRYSNVTGSMHCIPNIWNGFVLRYLQDHENVVTIVLSAMYTRGWVGIGFSRDGMMAGSSAMVGWIGREGKAKIKQYYLLGTRESEVIPNKGELPLTHIHPAVVINDAKIYLAFQLKFQAHLKGQPILLAFGEKAPIHSQLRVHIDKTSTTIDFSAGPVAGVSDNGIDQSITNHGVLGLVAWGLLLPVGAIIARYFRHRDPLWYYLHTVIQFIGFILGIANVVTGTILYKVRSDIPVHRGMGITVLVLCILQVMAFFIRPDKEAKIRKYWNWYHNSVGRVALFLAAVNVVLGIQYAGAGDAWKIGYGFILAVILVAVIVLEVLLRLRGPQKTLPPASQMNPVY